ncbi:MAG: O-antigen ligase family protein [Candidatus Omnitrophica bacterium]|nr:O-antigen ligase family protein [Candidatus Omnitrophota bacterium]MDD5661600.1 O-antigen ligase family protein [Candidatus Omnitrophota bacterium]
MTIILLILIFLRPFVSSLALPYANFIHSGLLLIFAAIWIITQGVSLKANKLTSPITLLCLALFLSLIFHYNNTAGAQELYKYIGGILILLICGSLSGQDQGRVILSIMIAGILISFLAMHQYFFGFRHLNNYVIKEGITNPFVLDYVRQGRAFFPFITPNTLGGYLAMLIPLTFISKHKALLALPLFFALLLTKSIGALLSLSLALILYFYLWNRFKKRDILIFFGLLITVILVFVIRAQVQKQHLQPLFSTTMRLNYWQDTLAIINTQPLSGVGLGNFNLALSRYSHNSYLQIWAETGILGITAFIWLVVLILRFSLKTLEESPDRRKTAALICSVCVFLIHNLMDFSFFLPEVSLIWWAILGLLSNRQADARHSLSVDPEFTNFND